MTAFESRQIVQRLTDSQTACTVGWHAGTLVRPPEDELQALVQQQHQYNFDLWHEEDKARDPHATEAQIAAVKRAIDKLNQQRNDMIEKLDEWLADYLRRRGAAPPADAPWNSETVGSVIDRLSILSLKIHHMREQTQRHDAGEEHLGKCRARLEVLVQQRQDLRVSLEVLLADLLAGRKQLKLYRQFKMYNDPDLNPQVYGKNQHN